MQTIWKFPLAMTDRQTISVPAEATALSVAEQIGGLSLWAMIDTEEKEKEEWVIEIYGTDHQVGDAPSDFIGTVVMACGFVWHVFKRSDDEDEEPCCCAACLASSERN